MKIIKGKNYGSIPHLSTSKLGKSDRFIHEGQERILTEKTRDKNDVIYVLEKYDGSNVGVYVENGNVYGITRSGCLAKESEFMQHKRFDEWVNVNSWLFLMMLKNKERICGEWLYQVHSLHYCINPFMPIVFFDWFDKNNNRYPMEKIINSPFQSARILHKGTAIKPEYLLDVLNKKTYYAKSLENPEGMIYRVERNKKFDFMAKWVRPDFEAGKFLKQEIKQNIF